MKHIALSIDQMKHLEELGLDTSDASHYWLDYTEEALKDMRISDVWKPSLLVKYSDNQKKNEFEIITPAYTLQEILFKLPDVIHYEDYGSMVYKLVIYKNGDWMEVYYEPDEEAWDDEYLPHINEAPLIGFINSDKDDILDISYNALVWCLENGYLENKII